MRVIYPFLFGGFFGIILILSQAFHWSRIQEMFHFKSFHMYGLLFSAIFTGVVSVFIIRRFKVKTIKGEEIHLKKKPVKLRSNILGGLVFGAGWALTGACTAPAFILLGINWRLGLFLLSGALVGALLFGLLSKKV
jgi:uncharacterized membrane protein YedE/YeeE